jgi:hypothetical protein
MPKRRNKAPDEFQLYQVVTVPEASELWGIPRNSVMYAIDASTGADHDDLVYRKSGSTWLITVASLTRRWGPPARRDWHKAG